jgi:DMSO/TMAO reductase YedYZ molybdopterin-dependent catalytic subunit
MPPSLSEDLPPGQHQLSGLPVPQFGPPPQVTRNEWTFHLVFPAGRVDRWDWPAFVALPAQQISVDLHRVAGWSVLASEWDAVSVHDLFEGVDTSARYAIVHSYNNFCANLPMDDLLEMPTWLAFAHDGHPLAAEDGGPVRLLVPHLYLWKSVPWVHGITLTLDDRPGTWEQQGYHNYGDPWREQRRRGD